MVLRKLVISYVLVQDLQNAVIGFPQFVEPPLAQLIEAPSGISRNQQKPCPDAEVRPGQKPLGLPAYRSAKRCGIHQVHPYDKKDGGYRRLHSAPAPKIIGRHECWQIIKGQNQALAGDEEIDNSCSSNNREDQQKLFVNIAES